MRVPLVMSPIEAAQLQYQRACGDCTVCCTLPQILPIPDGPELLRTVKDHYTHCPYLRSCGAGCSIYDDRPSLCQEFQCLWRAGMVSGDDRRRPDKLGIMFGMNAIGEQPYIEAWEVWEGAAQNHPARGVIEAVASRTPLLVRYYGVPCSLIYRDAHSLARGAALSRMARENPPALAAWIKKEMAVRGLVEDRENENFQALLAKMEASPSKCG